MPYDKHSISLKLNELNYLLATIAVLENELARYILAQHDVITYVTAATGTNVFIQRRPEASTYILYDQLYDEIKRFM